MPRPGSSPSGSCTRCCRARSEEHTSELQSPCNLVCRLLLEKKKTDDLPASAVRRLDGPARAWSRGRGPHLRRRAGGRYFFFNDTATTEIYTLSLHDALPIYSVLPG